jgi:hypothetical protein
VVQDKKNIFHAAIGIFVFLMEIPCLEWKHLCGLVSEKHQ